jgi:nitrogen fixation NifU-like protein
MNDLRELYQEVILDHGRNPRNLGTVPDANHQADGHNPLCGDRIHISLKVEGGVVVDMKFEGAGCAISMASTSVLTEVALGKTPEEVKALFARFHEMVTSPIDEDVDMDGLGKLAVFGGVREFPVRIKCATLAWHTLEAALDDPDAEPDSGATSVTTE